MNAWGNKRGTPSMITGLALGVTAVVVAAMAAGGYLFARHHEARLLDGARVKAQVEAGLIKLALEHQMLENDRELIRRMVGSFGADPGIERVMVLDRAGQPRFWSGRLPPERSLALDSPTCRVCHDRTAARRGHSAVIETDGGTVLRSVVPIENRVECHACHDPNHGINGVLIVDSRTEPMSDALRGDLRWFALGSGGIALGLLATLALLVRIFVLRRLARFEEAARAIAAGDLTRRVPESGNDTLSWLGREFNAMAESASRLLGEMNRQREQLETVLNGVDDGILVLDPGLRVVAANDALLARVARSREELIGRPCREALAGLCDPSGCPGASCFASGEGRAAIVAHAGVGGAVRHEEVRASPIRAEGGAQAYVVEVWRDITERRAQEARMAESHRLASLGMLASGFSHEINTPLASALICIESMLAAAGDQRPAKGPEGEDDERAARQLRLAREQILRCRGITQHFLQLSRGQDAASDVVDAAPIAASVVLLAEPTAREHGVAVAVDTGEGPAMVRAGDAQIQQVLLNLVLNAIQACDRGGTVQVIVRREGGRVRLCVRDDGRGIQPADLGRIFEPFFSLRPGGTGLGLFLSLNLVRSWGGEILVSSEPGRGSGFDVVFPPPGGDAKEPSGSAARFRGGPGGGEARSAEQPPGAEGTERPCREVPRGSGGR